MSFLALPVLRKNLNLNCFSYFRDLKIMKQTETVITWPSKLKIGAKSKKGKSDVKPQPVHFRARPIFR